MQGKRKARLRTLALILLSAILLTSCVSKPEPSDPTILPYIEFPDFVIPPNATVVASGDSEVKVSFQDRILVFPLWFWEDLLCYKIDVDKCEAKYNVLRKAYNP